MNIEKGSSNFAEWLEGVLQRFIANEANVISMIS